MAMPKSKRKTRSDKFPLTLHKTGQFCKKIKGKMYYFGTDRPQALQNYLEQASCLHAGRTAVSPKFDDEISLINLCNLYLEHQHSRVLAGEIKLRQVYDQTSLLKDFVRTMGAERNISEIKTLDLQDYRNILIKKGKSAARINNHISAFKAMYHWASENEIIAKMPNLPAIKKLTCPLKERPTFSPLEVKSLLEHANIRMRAMIWLGLNCGLGCTDCAELLWKHVDLKQRRIDFPRTKTGIHRRLPLWNETIEALKKLTRINNRVFNTADGKKVVSIVQRIDGNGDEKIVKCDNVSRDFASLLKKAKIVKGKGTGFYTLRRTAATLTAASGDPFAVQRLLGHADLKMATTYVQDVSEQTDRAINNARNLIVQQDS
jgi:integrase